MTIMTITTVSARDAAVDATASNNKADEAARPPPPMLPHTSQDFQFAERALQQIVLFSSFFPARAAQADWFPSHDPIEAKMRGGSFCDEHSSSAGSLATADTVSDTSSPLSYGDSPVRGRASIDIALATSSMPHPPLIADVIDAPPPDLAAVDAEGGRPPAPASSLPRRVSESDLTPAALARRVTLARLTLSGAKEEDAERECSPVPSIHEKEIDYGSILGKGGFCEVRLVSLKKDRKSKKQQHYAMKYLSPTKFAPKENPKEDKDKNSDDKPPRNKKFERGIADLAIEARFLALLSHENIISLHYVSRGALDTQFNCEGENNYNHQFGFFLLMDPLFETLTQKIDGTYIPEVFDRSDVGAVSSNSSSRLSSSWLMRRVRNRNSSKANNDPQLDAWRVQLAKRLESIKCIASALQYLHNHPCVVYRDIKPDNIGFYRKPYHQCVCGKRSATQRQHPSSPITTKQEECTCYEEIPKLFDMGLCKELKPLYIKPHPHYDGTNTYKLTARSGSRRYMAPEVAFGEPYNEKADTYSFGVMLYQVASLVTPFEGFSMKKHEQQVLQMGERPSLKIPSPSRKIISQGNKMSHSRWLEESDSDKKEKFMTSRTKCVWTQELQQLIFKCWQDDLRERPPMKEVVRTLEGCIRDLVKC